VSPPEIRAFIRRHVSRDQFADDLQMLRAARRTGGKVAVGGGLRGKAALRVAGYAAHETYEQLFRDNVPLHGGVVADDLLPGTDVVVHQTVAVYGPVFIARATVGRSRDLPTSNATRRNAARLNAAFDQQGSLELGPPPAEHCFVLLLTRRDPEDIGAYAGIDIAVLASDFSGFSLYEDADAFLAGYGEAEAGAAAPEPQPKDSDMGITLRRGVTPFEGGENGAADEPADG
jgi:hypothetical protein